MATNTILTTDEVTAIALTSLANMVEFLPHIKREYDGFFGQENKIGSSLQVRVPSFYSTDNAGPGVTLQGISETSVILVANNQPKVAISLTDQQKSLAISDLVSEYIEPATSQLSSFIDSYLLGLITGYSYSSTTGIIPQSFVGSYTGFSNIVTPGGLSNGAPVAWTGVDYNSAATTAAVAVKPFNNAKARLSDESTPGREYTCVLSPSAMANTVSQAISLFNDKEIVSEAFRSGLVKEYSGAIFKESALVPTFTSGTWSNSGSPQVNTSSNTGDTSIVLKSVGSTAQINQGDQFTIAGVYATNRLTGAVYSYLRVFVATAQATASGGVVTVNVNPAIIVTGANVAGPTVSVLPTANAAITFVGTANTSTQVGIFFWKDAVTAAFPPLPSKLAGAEVGFAMDPESKISLRMVKQYQSTVGTEVSRLETLLGGAILRPQNGIRLQA